MNAILQKQYNDAKQAAGGAILLFKIGDFYEAFHDDARAVAKILGLALTTRSRKDETPVPMAGFPYHQLDAYLAKIIAAGRRAAICEQVATEQAYQLKREPANRPRKLKIDNNPHARQAKLFDGLDCLPGQRDLYEAEQ